MLRRSSPSTPATKSHPEPRVTPPPTPAAPAHTSPAHPMRVSASCTPVHTTQPPGGFACAPILLHPQPASTLNLSGTTWHPQLCDQTARSDRTVEVPIEARLPTTRGKGCPKCSRWSPPLWSLAASTQPTSPIKSPRVAPEMAPVDDMRFETIEPAIGTTALPAANPTVSDPAASGARTHARPACRGMLTPLAEKIEASVTPVRCSVSAPTPASTACLGEIRCRQLLSDREARPRLQARAPLAGVSSPAARRCAHAVVPAMLHLQRTADRGQWKPESRKQKALVRALDTDEHDPTQRPQTTRSLPLTAYPSLPA
eukprot:3899005-Rhodomonas_salina.3